MVETQYIVLIVKITVTFSVMFLNNAVILISDDEKENRL